MDESLVKTIDARRGSELSIHTPLVQMSGHRVKQGGVKSRTEGGFVLLAGSLGAPGLRRYEALQDQNKAALAHGAAIPQGSSNTKTHLLTQKEPELETKSAWEEVLDKTSLPRYPLTATGRGMNVRLAEPSAGSLADPSSFTSQEDPSVMLSNLP